MKAATNFVNIKEAGPYTFYLKPIEYGDYTTVHKGKQVKKGDFNQLMNQNDTHIIMMMDYVKAEQIPNRIYNISQNIQRFNGSQATAKCLEWFRSQHYFYFVFQIDPNEGELVSLEKFLNTGNNFKNLPYQKKVKIAQNLANNLKSLHDHKIMHRTINPKHILISIVNDKIKFCGLKTMYVFENQPPPT